MKYSKTFPRRNCNAKVVSLFAADKVPKSLDSKTCMILLFGLGIDYGLWVRIMIMTLILELCGS